MIKYNLTFFVYYIDGHKTNYYSHSKYSNFRESKKCVTIWVIVTISNTS